MSPGRALRVGALSRSHRTGEPRTATADEWGAFGGSEGVEGPPAPYTGLHVCGGRGGSGSRIYHWGHPVGWVGAWRDGQVAPSLVRTGVMGPGSKGGPAEAAWVC